MTIVESLQKAERIEDQALIGITRVSRTTATVITVLQSIRDANLGPDTNAVVDELIKIGQKFQVIIGTR